MSDTVISVENLSKSYQLGAINTGTFYGDLKRWWARQRGRPDPYQKIGETDHGNRQGETLWALKDVIFQVRQGEALGIIGRNGAGKSTLLKILSRVTAPTSGLIKIKGRIASLLEVGTGFHPELTGRENIYLNGTILGMNKAEISNKFDEIVDFSGVEKFIDTPVKRYSSGMYVRLAFAVAVHLDAEILILDEVLAVGDSGFQKKSMEKIGGAAKSGKTVLFVSHSFSSVMRLCDRGLYLDQGKIIYAGSATDAVSIYLNKVHQIDDKRIEAEGGRPTQSYMDLNDNVKRWGGSKKILTWISTHRMNGQPSTEFTTGEGMRVRIGYHIDEEIDAYCNLNFLNYMGLEIMTVGLHHSIPDARISGDGYLECVIPEFLLVSGNYIIMVAIGMTVGMNERIALDAISDTIHINVNIGNFLNGSEISQLESPFAQRSEWEIFAS